MQEDEIKMLFGGKNPVKVLQVSKGNIYCQSKMMDKESIFHYAVALAPKHSGKLYYIQRNYLSTRKAGLGSLTDAVYVIPPTSLLSNPPLSLRTSCFNGKGLRQLEAAGAVAPTIEVQQYGSKRFLACLCWAYQVSWKSSIRKEKKYLCI